MIITANGVVSNSRFSMACRTFRRGNAQNAAPLHGASSAAAGECFLREADSTQMITSLELEMLNLVHDAEEKPRVAGEILFAETRSAKPEPNNNQGAMYQWQLKSILTNAPAVEIARMFVLWKQSTSKMAKPLSAIHALNAQRVSQLVQIMPWRCNLIKGDGMPRSDGTGPLGLGPGTGRGRGWCKTGIPLPGFGRAMFRGKNRWLFGMAVPVIVAAIRDLANPEGRLRQMARSLLAHSRDRNNAALRETGYTVIEQNNGDLAHHGKTTIKGTGK
jgi:hypothetical protein